MKSRLTIFFLLITLFDHFFCSAIVGKKRYEGSSMMYLEKVGLVYDTFQDVYFSQPEHAELSHFQNLLSSYLEKIEEAYEIAKTQNSITQNSTDFLAEAKAIRVLTYLSLADSDPTAFERAAYDYFDILDLYKDTDEPPILLRPLSKPIRFTDSTYVVLMKAIEDFGQDMNSFSRVILKFPTNHGFNSIELSKLSLAILEPKNKDATAQFSSANDRISKAVSNSQGDNSEILIPLALPPAIYYIKEGATSYNIKNKLSRLYVREQNFHLYEIKKLNNRVIAIENPSKISLFAEKILDYRYEIQETKKPPKTYDKYINTIFDEDIRNNLKPNLYNLVSTINYKFDTYATKNTSKAKEPPDIMVPSNQPPVTDSLNLKPKQKLYSNIAQDSSQKQTQVDSSQLVLSDKKPIEQNPPNQVHSDSLWKSSKPSQSPQIESEPPPIIKLPKEPPFLNIILRCLAQASLDFYSNITINPVNKQKTIIEITQIITRVIKNEISVTDYNIWYLAWEVGKAIIGKFNILWTAAASIVDFALCSIREIYYSP